LKKAGFWLRRHKKDREPSDALFCELALIGSLGIERNSAMQRKAPSRYALGAGTEVVAST
jgi:hypothetical protein